MVTMESVLSTAAECVFAVAEQQGCSGGCKIQQNTLLYKDFIWVERFVGVFLIIKYAFLKLFLQSDDLKPTAPGSAPLKTK